MVTQSNPQFFKKLEALLDANLEKDLHSIMVKTVESEAKNQVYGQSSVNSAIKGNKGKAVTGYNAHNDIDEYHPAGHLNRVTGTLGRSITTETDREGDVITSVVGSNLEYARIHELGGEIKQGVSQVAAGGRVHETSRRRIYIPARPYLVPALELRKDEVIEYMSDRVQKMVKRASK